jgi:hypothetical protein
MKITPDVFDKDRIITNTIPWKSKVTFNQLGSIMKKNYTNKINNLQRDLLFKPPPLKIYRREIASIDISGCKSRASVKIDHYDMPGVNIITKTSGRGINALLDINYENNTGKHPSLTITDPTYCNLFLDSKNARRRCRSSGIIKPNYSSSNAQYLYSRNMTFKQNEFFHVRQGNPLAAAGSSDALNNIYASNSGVQSCKKYFMSSTYFYYNWINLSNIRVDIPKGYYDIDDLNNLLQSVMFTRKHYLVTKGSNAKVYLLNFTYNATTNMVVLNSTVSNDVRFPNTTYSYPSGATWTLSTNPTFFNPNIILADTIICNAIGFAAGTFPAATSGSSSNYSISGVRMAIIQPNYYLPIYYKPSNSKFAHQGAVSSSDRLTRKKYDTITTAANTLRTAFGSQTTDALAYGVPAPGYTLKNVTGYPLIRTPVINKYNGQLAKCSRLRTIRNLTNG